MKKGKFNVVFDSAWGSSGKGKVASFLARTFGVTDASTCNMPNAGHTVQVDGERTVYKCLPAATHFGASAWLGPGSVIDEQRLSHEILFGKSGPVFVHERAGYLQPIHREMEMLTLSGISSTMQGSGACLTDKVMRKQEAIFGQDKGGWNGRDFRTAFRHSMSAGMVLHEVAQGWGLSVDHGTHYPHCTSRNCGVARAMDDMAIPPREIGDVYMVVRTFPIRVGNTADGYSGGWCKDQQETSWTEIEHRTGLVGLAEKERTTVTKRVRRVATFSWELTMDAIEANQPDYAVITFPEYIDARSLGVRNFYDLPYLVRGWVDEFQIISGVKVFGVSTGPETDQMAVQR